MEGMKTPKPRDWFLIIPQARHMADMYTVAVLSFSAGSPVPDTKGEQQGWEGASRALRSPVQVAEA